LRAPAGILGGMKTLRLLPLLIGLIGPACLTAKPVTVADLLAGSPAGDWRTPDPEDTAYLELPAGRVVIELAAREAPVHVANLRTLMRAHYFDGLAIVRVQDGYVVQWADPAAELPAAGAAGQPASAAAQPAHRRPVPAGIRASTELTAPADAYARFERLDERDVYAPEVGFLDGFPAARDPRTHSVWLAHCYGMVGAGRDDPPESDGTELYAIIGHAPRHLDRNVALVGRVLAGMEYLSSLPRGHGEMGFYVKDERPVPIRAMRLAADVPPSERTHLEVLRTDSATFHAVLEQRRHRHESWFQVDPGHIELCNVPLPVREAAAAAPASTSR